MRFWFDEAWHDVPTPPAREGHVRIAVHHALLEANLLHKPKGRVRAGLELLRDEPRLALKLVRHVQSGGVRRVAPKIAVGLDVAVRATDAHWGVVVGRALDKGGGIEVGSQCVALVVGALPLADISVAPRPLVWPARQDIDPRVLLLAPMRAMAEKLRALIQGREARVLGGGLFAEHLRSFLAARPIACVNTPVTVFCDRNVLLRTPNPPRDALLYGAATLCSLGRRLEFSSDRIVSLPPAAERVLDPRSGVPESLVPIVEFGAQLETANDAFAQSLPVVSAHDLAKVASTPGLVVRIDEAAPASALRKRPARHCDSRTRIALIGTGLFGRGTLGPAFVEAGANIVAVCDESPSVAFEASRQFNDAEVYVDHHELLARSDIGAVVIATRHDTHASIAVDALRASKAVFVEKPIALDRGQLEAFAAEARRARLPVQVGYNRPSSAAMRTLGRALKSDAGPVSMTCAVRLYQIPRSSYYYWPTQGDRIKTNMCHWIDLALWLVPVAPVAVSGAWVTERYDERCSMTIEFADGSLACIVLAREGEDVVGGAEQIHLMRGASSYHCDDFRILTRYRAGHREKLWSGRRDQGHRSHVRAAFEVLRSGCFQIDSLERAITVNRVVLAASLAVHERRRITLDSRDTGAGR